MFLSFSFHRSIDPEEYGGTWPVNVTNVKQTLGRWEQLQTVDGMLLHGCSQECASLPFVLWTNWGGGDRCLGRRNPRAKGYFSFVKSNQTRSVLILTPVKMPSSWGLNTGTFWATAGTKVPKDVGWRANAEANRRVKEMRVKIFEGGRAGRCLADEFKSFWRELGVNQMPGVREEMVVVRRWRPKSRGVFLEASLTVWEQKRIKISAERMEERAAVWLLQLLRCLLQEGNRQKNKVSQWQNNR